MTTSPAARLPVLLAPAGLPGPSGGTRYDVRLAREWGEQPLWVAGSWPRPTDSEVQDLRGRLAGLRAGPATSSRPVLVDGIVGCAAPEVVAEAVGAGQRVWLLVHLPLPAETGTTADLAARLAAAEAGAVTAATGVVVTSRWAAGDLLRRYGDRGSGRGARQVLVAEPGTDPPAELGGTDGTGGTGPGGRGEEPPVLLTPAVFSPRKNHRLLLDALEPLVDLPWTARWVGPHPPGGTFDALAQQIGRRRLGGRVRLQGPVPEDGMPPIWRQSALLLLPSLAETYAMVVAEALSHGIPALVGAGTAAEDTLRGGPRAGGSGSPELAGAALDPTCAQQWTAHLRRWMQDEELRRTWRERAALRAPTLPRWDRTAALVARTLTEEGG